MRWKIFYGDGTSVTDEDCEPENVPKRDVQAITVEDKDRGRRVEYSTDFYIWTDHGWRGCDQFGFFDYLISPGSKVVLFGRSLSDAEYNKVLHTATHDDYLPAKSAWGELERRPA